MVNVATLENCHVAVGDLSIPKIWKETAQIPKKGKRTRCLVNSVADTAAASRIYPVGT